MVAGFSGDPKFLVDTSGWIVASTSNNLPNASMSIVRNTTSSATVPSLKWGSAVAGGTVTWLDYNFAYGETDARINMIDLIPGNWYFLQCYIKFPTITSPRLQMICDTSYGSYVSNVGAVPERVGATHAIYMKFRASANTHLLRLFNFDTAPVNSSVTINGLFITDHILDPSFGTSVDGWTIQSDLELDVKPANINALSSHAVLPKTASGLAYPFAVVTASASFGASSRAVVFTKDDCVIGTVYQVLIRSLYFPGAAFFPFYLMLDNTQLAWAPNKVRGEFVVSWATFTATALSHQIKLVNSAAVVAGDSMTFAGMEIKPVASMLGETLNTTIAPSYPAKLNQTIYPCQPGYDELTVPQLVRQFQFMKDLGITQLMLEQVVNMSDRTAYYDTNLKISRSSIDPISGANISLPVVTMVNNLVDRIVEASTIVSGIDLWWGIGRYYPWEVTPVEGPGVASTVDPGVSWTSASWNTNAWGPGSSSEALAANAYIVNELVSKYGASIKGWYLPFEVESYGVAHNPNLVWFRTLFYELTKMCLNAKSGIPVLVSPFYQDLVTQGNVDEYNFKKEYAETLTYSYLPAAKYAKANGATKFIIAQQDGLGDGNRSLDGSEKIFHALFNSSRISDDPLDRAITELWHNVDLYDVFYNGGGPMESIKLQAIMNRLNLLNSRTSFSFASQMSPQSPSRRPYWSRYRKYAKGSAGSYGVLPIF